MIAVTYRIHLNEPAIFSTLDGDPNSAVSYPYIPGSAVRGLVIGLMLREHDPAFELDAAADGYHRVFFSPATRYLNAYPEINGARSLPVPATWTQPKYRTSEQPDAITDSALVDADTPKSSAKQKNLSGFTVVEGAAAHIYQPQITFNVHTVRARRDAGEQQVFRYEALADGQTFIGVILCASDEDAHYLHNLLLPHTGITLGGSRTAGYGRATLSDVQIVPDWAEVALPEQIAPELILTCASDILLRDENGVYRPTLAVLQTHLKAKGIETKVEAVSLKTVWVGGFNRKWGLPLPQTIAIERGSVFRLTGITPADREALQRLLSEGLGERREDGFGRVVLGWQNQRLLSAVKYQPAPAAPALSTDSQKLWKDIRGRIRDRQLEESVAGLLYDRRYTIYGDISRTQISRLRSVIANGLRTGQNRQAVINNFLEQIRGKAGGRQFNNARINSQPLSEWLSQPTFEGLSDNITKQDRYVLRLVDTVLERAYREREGK